MEQNYVLLARENFFVVLKFTTSVNDFPLNMLSRMKSNVFVDFQSPLYHDPTV